MAMMTLLETLAPDERAAFLLHEVFDVEYGRIASFTPSSTPDKLPAASES